MTQARLAWATAPSAWTTAARASRSSSTMSVSPALTDCPSTTGMSATTPVIWLPTLTRKGASTCPLATTLCTKSARTTGSAFTVGPKSSEAPKYQAAARVARMAGPRNRHTHATVAASRSRVGTSGRLSDNRPRARLRTVCHRGPACWAFLSPNVAALKSSRTITSLPGRVIDAAQMRPTKFLRLPSASRVAFPWCGTAPPQALSAHAGHCRMRRQRVGRPFHRTHDRRWLCRRSYRG